MTVSKVIPAAMAIAGAAVLFSSSNATAEIVVGGAVGYSELSSYDDVDEALGWKGFAGYRASSVPVYAEIGYVNSGELEVDSLNVDLEFDGFTAAVGYRMVVDSYNGSDVVFKIGGYTLDTEASGPGGSIEEDGSGLLVGIGGNWMFTPHLGLHADAQILFGVEDFANDEDLTLLTIGLMYAFFE